MRGKHPKSEVFWYRLKKPKVTRLDRNLELDVVIVGGGMAGLMCAQKLKVLNKHIRLAVVEASLCGAGASGKSSGFITPDSELELTDLVENYGEEDGKRLWEFVKKGVSSIRETISHRSIRCDFTTQDSLFIANTPSGYKKVRREYAVQKKLGYDAWLYDKDKIQRVVGSENYEGAVRYKETFGMISYLYCQELKESLQRDGVALYEESPMGLIRDNHVLVAGHRIDAEKIIVCTDRFLPEMDLAKSSIYSAQTFLAVSKPIPQEIIHNLFPSGPMMVWDTDILYQYYRIVQGNRLLIGASSIVYTYRGKEKKMSGLIMKKMYAYLAKKFPRLHIELDYFWPGLIGVSKDFLPIMGRDPKMKNVYFVGAAAGLPWAAALGEYVAEAIVEGRHDFDKLFSPNRVFPINDKAQFILSKPLSFALSHGIKKYFH